MSGLTSNIWNRRIELAGGNYVVMHSRSAIVQYAPAVQVDYWGGESREGRGGGGGRKEGGGKQISEWM